MIVVRDVFQLKFGKAKEAKAAWREGLSILRKTGHQPIRILTDVAGPAYYTMVLESTFQSLAEFEKGHKDTTPSEEWQAWYRGFTPLVESGYREIFEIVE